MQIPAVEADAGGRAHVHGYERDYGRSPSDEQWKQPDQPKSHPLQTSLLPFSPF
jgi:hypothetical protein